MVPFSINAVQTLTFRNMPGIALIVLLALLSLPAFGNRMQVMHYTVEDGLSANSVYSISQDSRGLIWLGTVDGLHSFDGNAIRVWRDPKVASLGSLIYSVKEGPDSKLWIGSDSGLTIFDLKKEKFEDFSKYLLNGFSINTAVHDVLFDSRGMLWIATYGKGILRYDPRDKSLKQYIGKGKTISDYIGKLLEDSSGRIWAVSNDEGASVYVPDQDLFRSVDGGGLKNVMYVYEDSDRRIWAGSWDGLYELDKKNRKFVRRVSPRDSSGVMLVRRIVEDHGGRLLFVSDNGLGVYDKKTGKCDIIGADEKTGFNDHHLHSIFIDRDKGLWIGSYFGGVNYIPAMSNRFITHSYRNSSGLKGKIISVVAPADGRNLWLGTDDAGFYYWNRTDNTFGEYDSKVPGKGPTYNNIHALLQNGDKLFVGMYAGGLDIFDISTGSFRNYRSSSNPRSLYSQSVYALLRDRDGNIWVGTSRGVNRYVPESDDFERVFEAGLADVEFMFQDSQKYVYALSLDKGMFMRDPKSGKWENFTASPDWEKTGGLPSNKLICGAEDSKRNIWLGTDGMGLIRFDRNGKKFSRVDLPDDIRSVFMVLAYRDRLWLTSNAGLFCYYPRTGMLRHFSKTEGLSDNVFRPNSGYLSADGTAFFGGTGGIVEFRPDEFRLVPQNHDVILTDFRLFNKPVRTDDEDSPLKTSITYAEELRLKNDQSNFSFKVAVLNYSNPSQNEFNYKLEGFDKDWNEATSDHTVSYTNLPPGHYEFRVRTSNGLGGWNEDAISFPITVLPPWWLSWPMIVAYVLVFILGCWLFYRYLTLRQKRKFEKIAMENEKAANQRKIDFFTQMAHELRTPLTLILSPLETMMRSKEKEVVEAMPQLRVMERNGNRLMNLVNQLMDFRKIETGNIKVSMMDRDIRAELQQTIHNFSSYLKARRIETIVVVPKGKCMARIDKEAFSHIMINLLSNALHFARTGISVSLTDDGDGRYRIDVKDDGPGIPAKERERIFEPFYQIRENRPSDNMGTGIGLMLVRKYAQVIGAEIALESEPGKGACFSVFFRKSDLSAKTGEHSVESRKADAEESVAEVTEDAVEMPAKAKVLVVDDNPDMREFLRSLLSDEFNVDTASDGQEALDRLAGHECDLILSDVMMPVVDGFELCRRVKGDIATSHIPVILLTAKVDSEDFVEGYENGADAYVGKPFSSEVIRAQVKGLIKNRARMRSKFRSDPAAEVEIVPNSDIDKEFFDKVSEIILKKISDPDFSVDTLAQEVGMSRTRLFTKIKGVMGMTPNAFIRIIKLRKAAELLSQPDARVNEVCYEVGFSSRSHFAKCFQEQFGVTPTEYRNGKDSKLLP